VKDGYSFTFRILFDPLKLFTLTPDLGANRKGQRVFEQIIPGHVEEGRHLISSM
jgi:hypothetical protein